MTDEIIFLALDGLKKEKLLEDNSQYVSPFAEMNRRAVIRKVGLASLIALPVISNLIAPTAGQAASACGIRFQSCSGGNFQQGTCCSGFRCTGNGGNAAQPGVCDNCRGTGVPYFLSCGGDINCCNGQISKNLCCNGGSATISGNDCLCP